MSDDWILRDDADRTAFERQGGFVNAFALSGAAAKRWHPKLAVEVPASALPTSAATPVLPQGTLDILRGMQAVADEQAQLSKEVLNLTSTGPPDWFKDVAAVSTSDDDADPVPRGSLLNTRPVASEPLRDYCKLALSRCDEGALAAAVEQWVRWGVSGYESTTRRKRRRTEAAPAALEAGGSQDVEGASKGDEAPQAAVKDREEDRSGASDDDPSDDEAAVGGAQQAFQTHVDVLAALVMNRRDILLHDRYEGSAQVRVVEECNDPQDAPPDAAALPLSDALRLIRGTTKVLRDAVHRQRRVVRRFHGSGLDGLVTHHAKELNTTTTAAAASSSNESFNTFPTIPLLEAVREQHGRVIGAHDALSDAQSRFMEANRAARIALEDAADAARLVATEQRAMETLLHAAAIECNAVDEIRQILVQELRGLKQSIASE